MGEVEMEVVVPAWLEESLAQLAAICEKSIDYVAGALFANEVVHTLHHDPVSFCG